MGAVGNGVQPINSFALVTYIRDPLGQFLDKLRCELVPACVPRAHVTILPPRPLWVPLETAWDEIWSRIREVPPFEIELTGVSTFESTSVIYIALGKGREALERLHDLLNTGPLAFQEPYLYHPHITLAQDLAPGEVAEVYELACRRWAEFPGERRFLLETVSFVQNTVQNRWLDLAHAAFPAMQVPAGSCSREDVGSGL